MLDSTRSSLLCARLRGPGGCWEQEFSAQNEFCKCQLHNVALRVLKVGVAESLGLQTSEVSRDFIVSSHQSSPPKVLQPHSEGVPAPGVQGRVKLILSGWPDPYNFARSSQRPIDQPLYLPPLNLPRTQDQPLSLALLNRSV